MKNKQHWTTLSKRDERYKMMNWLDKASANDARLVLHNIVSNEGRVYASNGHVMHMIETHTLNNLFESSSYPPMCYTSNKRQYKQDNLFSGVGRFPDVSNIIPRGNGEYQVTFILGALDVKKLKAFVRVDEYVKLTFEPKRMVIENNPKHDYTYKAVTDNIECNVKTSQHMYLNLQFLINVLDNLDKNTLISLCTFGKISPIRIEFEQHTYKHTAVFMPVIMKQGETAW